MDAIDIFKLNNYQFLNLIECYVTKFIVLIIKYYNIAGRVSIYIV